MEITLKYFVSKFRPEREKWVAMVIMAAAVIILPLLFVVTGFTGPASDTWRHFATSLIPEYAGNTILLLLGTGSLSLLMGVIPAWLVTMYRFPGRRFLAWALVMPLAIPAYINGYTWAGMLDFTSPLYTFLREWRGINTGAYLFIDLLSLKGAVFIFSLSLYPYVYLISRAFFLSQSGGLLEVSASLGKSSFQTFLLVAVPLARPAMVAGVSLVLMEVLNDYGLVKYFGVETFTTGIFSAWFAFGDRQVALRLAGWLMIFVLALIIIEKLSRGKARYDTTGSSYRPVQSKKPGKLAAAGAFIICILPVMLGFLLPFTTLLLWAFRTAGSTVDLLFLRMTANSFILAASAAAIGMAVALLMLFALRASGSKTVMFLSKAATLGYAVPGAVVAIGVLSILIGLETELRALAGSWLPSAGNLWPAGITAIWQQSGRGLLATSVFALLYAYLVRFLAVGYNSLESGYDKISPGIDEAAASLGSSKKRLLAKIHLPLLKGSLLGGGLLIFVDVLKELPLTLILRPFNFDTLAIKAFEYASDERIAQSSSAAVIIVLTGMIPALLLNRMLSGGKGNEPVD